MELIKIMAALLAASIIISTIITLIFSKSSKGYFISFLVILKTLLVAVLVASSVMLFSIIYKSNLNQIGQILVATVAKIFHKGGRYFQGDIIVGAMLGILFSFVISKILLLIEIFVGSIGNKRHVPAEASSSKSTISNIMKGPFWVIRDIFFALIFGILIASIGDVIGIVSRINHLHWQLALVAISWWSALLGYFFARWQSWMLKASSLKYR